MKRKKFWIGAAACMLIGTASVAASSGVELHEFFNANGERVMYRRRKRNSYCGRWSGSLCDRSN